MSNKSKGPSSRLIEVIIALVAVAWFASIAYGALNPDYEADPTIGLAFMAILSGLLGTYAAQRSVKPAPEEAAARQQVRRSKNDEEQGARNAD